jgi:20S proteasome subunit alpha 3
MEAISHAGAAVGILGQDGVVLACEKKLASKLLEPGACPIHRDRFFIFLFHDPVSDGDTLTSVVLLGKRSEKMYRIDDHIACAVAGITADANILLNYSRLAAQRYHLPKQNEEALSLQVNVQCY